MNLDEFREIITTYVSENQQNVIEEVVVSENGQVSIDINQQFYDTFEIICPESDLEKLIEELINDIIERDIKNPL